MAGGILTFKEGSSPTSPSAGYLRLFSKLDNTLWTKDSTGAEVQVGAYIPAGSIVDADVSPTAGIQYSKLNLSLSIVNADISSSAAIDYSKLNLASSIVDADISPTAAIAVTKIGAVGALSEAYGFTAPADTLGQILSKIQYSNSWQLDTVSVDAVVLDGYTWMRSDIILSGTTTVSLEGTSTLRVI